MTQGTATPPQDLRQQLLHPGRHEEVVDQAVIPAHSIPPIEPAPRAVYTAPETAPRLGDDGGRPFNWLDDRMSTGPSGQVFRELMATVAVIAGRRTFELADRWQGDHHDGVPVHVLTHHVDDGDVTRGREER